jgi:hypothetical protein
MYPCLNEINMLNPLLLFSENGSCLKKCKETVKIERERFTKRWLSTHKPTRHNNLEDEHRQL